MATEGAAQFFKDNSEHYAKRMAQIPLGRLGDPEQDAGGLVVFLASPGSRYFTGEYAGLRIRLPPDYTSYQISPPRPPKCGGRASAVTAAAFVAVRGANPRSRNSSAPVGAGAGFLSQP